MKLLLYQIVLGLCVCLVIPSSLALPITGNPAGNITLVEYYDYECPHCRRMEAVIEQLQANYPDLKVVYRVTPLLNPTSELVARFTLSVTNPALWERLHQELMLLPRTPTLDDAKRIATQLRLNANNLLHMMQRASVEKQMATNIDLAASHGINGAIYLPILVVGQSNGVGQPIVLTGEQSYSLLSAIVSSEQR